MEELDLLKKDWNKNGNYPKVSEQEIYGMLHKNSSSIVKWIMIISILEVFFWIFLNLFFDADKQIKNLDGTVYQSLFKYIILFTYSVSAVFIFLFYKNYKNISTVTSTKQLMKDILKTKKTVTCYVWYNLVMMAVGTILGFFVSFSIDPKIQEITETHQSFYIVAILICLIVIVIFCGLFWLFYRLLYGILLKKLKKNFEELKKIDL